MAPGKAVDAALFLKDRLGDRGVGVSKIILFGSRARGRADDESDIDLIVVSEDFRNRDIFERAELIGDVEYLTVKQYKIPIDLFLKTPEEIEEGASVTADFAAREGVVVWAA